MTYLPVIFGAGFLLIAGFYINSLHTQEVKQELRISVSNQLSVIRAQLEGNINSNAQLVKGLVVAISTEPNMTQKRYAELSEPLLQSSSELRNIAAAPNLVIRYMFPIKGNESAIGLEYRKHPLQYNAVKNAIKLNKLVVAGPVNLVQGGQGFIARIPIYIKNDKSDKNNFWGIISAVIDSKILYESSGLTDENLNIEIAIRGKDALGDKGDVFFGDEKIFNLDPILAQATLPYGSWQLAAIPKGGWTDNSTGTAIFQLVLIFIFTFILVLLFVLTRFIIKKKENEALLTGLFELSPIGIALNDYETGKFINVNNSIFKPTGYSREEFINLSYWELTPKEYESQEKQQLELMEKSNRYGPYEKEYIRKDGSRYPVLLSGMVVHDSHGKKLIWSIVEDITERKRIDRMKSEFISTVSHELRTPLTSITGALSVTTEGVLGDLPDKALELLNVAFKNSKRLTYLINDLLDIEKLASNKMQFDMQVCELNQQIEEAVSSNQSYAEQYNIELNSYLLNTNVKVNIDIQRLQQVLSNLISNAVKFSIKGSHVDIRVTLNHDVVRIEIIDSGRGIPKEFHKHIFQRFAQADSSDTRVGSGTGLGLAISQELIEKMNGNIGFESVIGKGSTFYIELPIKS